MSRVGHVLSSPFPLVDQVLNAPMVLFTAHGIAVTQSAAAKFIAMQSPVQYTADNLLAHACTKKIVNGFVAWPKVFAHDVPDTETEVASYIRS